jgi:hypothetical protein
VNRAGIDEKSIQVPKRTSQGSSMEMASRVRKVSAFLLASTLPLGAWAQTLPPPPSPGSAVNLAPVAVSGVLPGPALWKVSKGDHVMWVLGITSPLPKHMEWESSEVDHLIATSQQVLRLPNLEIGAKLGFWGQLFLLPSMIGMKKLPEGQTLQQVLPPALYGRWQVQEKKYLGHSGGADRLRPTFAGEKLYNAALSQSGLRDSSKVVDAVYSSAKKNKVLLTNTSYRLMLDDPRSTLKQFKKATMDDQRCLTDSMDAIDQNFSQATERANAWATGDLPTLRKILSTKQKTECLSAIGSSQFAKNLGMTDIPDRIEKGWVKAAEAALTNNRQSVALLNMSQIVANNGYLTVLQKDGYTVTSPESLTETEAAP